MRNLTRELTQAYASCTLEITKHRSLTRDLTQRLTHPYADSSFACPKARGGLHAAYAGCTPQVSAEMTCFATLTGSLMPAYANQRGANLIELPYAKPYAKLTRT